MLLHPLEFMNHCVLCIYASALLVKNFCVIIFIKKIFLAIGKWFLLLCWIKCPTTFFRSLIGEFRFLMGEDYFYSRVIKTDVEF